MTYLKNATGQSRGNHFLNKRIFENELLVFKKNDSVIQTKYLSFSACNSALDGVESDDGGSC